jgi:hypothetical protein
MGKRRTRHQRRGAPDGRDSGEGGGERQPERGGRREAAHRRQGKESIRGYFFHFGCAGREVKDRAWVVTCLVDFVPGLFRFLRINVACGTRAAGFYF